MKQLTGKENDPGLTEMAFKEMDQYKVNRNFDTASIEA